MTKRSSSLVLGDWNAICYRCGRKRKASEMQKQWQGYYVCAKHWEERHPQDFVQGTIEEVAPPWIQSEDTYYFIPVAPPPNYTLLTTPPSFTAIAGKMMTGKAITGSAG